MNYQQICRKENLKILTILNDVNITPNKPQAECAGRSSATGTVAVYACA